VCAQDGTVYRSPFDLKFSSDDALLAVSDRTAGELVFIDVTSGKVKKAVALKGEPTGVAWGDGTRIYVSEYDAGTVAEIDTATFKVIRRFSTGPKPIGVTVARKKKLLLVCNSGLNSVSVIDLNTGKERTRVKAVRMPWSVAVTANESLAVVGNLLPFGSATNHKTACAATLIDLEKCEKLKDVQLPPGSSSAGRVALSSDGKWAYLPHTIGHTTLPTTQLERGWVNNNAVSILNLEKKEYYTTLLLDTISEGAADPWGAVVSRDGTSLWVTLAGVHQLAHVRIGKIHARIDNKTSGKHLARSDIWRTIAKDRSKRTLLAYDMGALPVLNLLKRYSISGLCPRGIALSHDGTKVAVGMYYSGTVLLVDTTKGAVVSTIAVGPLRKPDIVRHGEQVFHDGTRCFQRWLSCATCHPGGGRTDGLNWDLLNDGVGNPKNTKSLVHANRTPPVMSLGVRSSMEVATEKGFKFIQFHVPKETELKATRAYLRSLAPASSPYRVGAADGRIMSCNVCHKKSARGRKSASHPSLKGALSPQARKGQTIFESSRTGCAKCHPGPLFTDLKTYDVGTRHELDRNDVFDNPTCLELWHTGPFLHDGSAKTLKDMLTIHNKKDRHGKTSHLKDDEIDALVKFLRSL